MLVTKEYSKINKKSEDDFSLIIITKKIVFLKVMWQQMTLVKLIPSKFRKSCRYSYSKRESLINYLFIFELARTSPTLRAGNDFWLLFRVGT